MLSEAIRIGLEHREEALEYAEQFGRGIDRATADRFVEMYVNELTCDYGESQHNGVFDDCELWIHTCWGNPGAQHCFDPNISYEPSVDIYLNQTTRHADVVLPGQSTLTRGHYDVAFSALACRNRKPSAWPRRTGSHLDRT